MIVSQINNSKPANEADRQLENAFEISLNSDSWD